MSANLVQAAALVPVRGSLDGWQKAVSYRAYLRGATAVNTGVWVRDDYDAVIEDVVRREFPLLAIMRKERAMADVVNDVRKTALPAAAVVSKTALENTTASNPAKTTGTNQEVKAWGVAVTEDYYYGRLYLQQGSFLGNQFEQDTDDAVASVARLADSLAITGSVGVDALQFNGISVQFTTTATIDARTGYTAASRAIMNGLRKLVRQMTDSTTLSVRPNIIIAPSILNELLEREMEASGTQNLPLAEIVPGVKVSAIRADTPSNGGLIPILNSPFCERNDGAGSPPADDITVYLSDSNQLIWKYVEAADGQTWNPTVFEVNPTDMSQNKRRQVLMFGTAYVRSAADAHRKITIQLADATI